MLWYIFYLSSTLEAQESIVPQNILSNFGNNFFLLKYLPKGDLVLGYMTDPLFIP